jgi:hypothetical protein
LDQLAESAYPFPSNDAGEDAPFIPQQVRFLQGVFQNMRQHPDPKVCTKFLTNWDMHVLRYPQLIQAMVASDFNLASLAPAGTWDEEVKAMNSDIADFWN